MNDEKKYNEALERARKLYEQGTITESLCYVFPELKESEDERIRKELISFFTERAKYTEDSTFNGLSSKGIIAWLEKQSNINEPINRDKFAQGILRGAAINLITWIDYNAAEGNMCLSNMECKDIEDSLVNGNWDKIYAYIKKKLEKQDEKKPAWSEDDKRNINELLYIVEANYLSSEEPHDRLINFLEFLRGRVQPQPMQEWSEEDEQIALSIEQVMNCASLLNIVPEKIDKIRTWLKSLKERYTWKPSDEQIRPLEYAIDYFKKKNNDTTYLESLYQDLKKLEG